jgi:filamin
MAEPAREEFTLPQKRTWVDVQKKTFTGWANTFLSERLMKIEDLEFDLEDGKLLCNLLEEISGKKVSHNKNAKMRIQKVENNSYALRFIQQEGLKLVGIGAEDIVDHKLKLILGLIWTLILRYQIQQAGDGDSPKKALLEWVNRQIAPYGLQVGNFTEDWTSGRALSALCDSLSPGVLLQGRDLSGLSGNRVGDIDKAMDVAQAQYEIPKILDAVDMAEYPEELSNITYVSYYRDYLENHAEKERQRLLRSAYAGYCYAYGPGLEGAIVNVPTGFTIQAVNVYEDALTHGGENGFAAEIKRDDGETIPCVITDQNNGKYEAKYTALLPGDYTVNVTLNGEKIKDMPKHVKIIGADAGASNAFGPGLQGANVGKPAPFKIQARDASGAPLKGGGDDFQVTVHGPENLGKQEVKDNGNGTYDVVYHPTKLGTYTVEIKLRGEHISNSPVQVLCQDGVAANSWADGPGLEDGVRTHHPATFTVHSVDIDGKPVRHGGEPFVAKIAGPVNKDIPLKDNGDGTYTGTYNVDKPGDYTVDISLYDEPIRDMPKSVHVKASSDAGKSYAEGPGLDNPATHKPQEFTIHAIDHDGHPRTDGGEDFKVVLSGPETIHPDVRDNGDGTYTVQYEPKKAGDYKVNVTLEDTPIKDMPRTINVKATPAAGKTWADGPGLESGKVFDNEPTYFTIHAVDHDGKPRTDGGDNFDVKISGPAKITPEVIDNGDGTYTVKYEPDVAGDYVIDVTAEGEHIKDAPFHVEIKEGTDAHNSTAQFAITVQAKDKHGNPKTFGGDSFEVYIRGGPKGAPKSDCEGIDNGDGTYTARYTLETPGEYKVSVKLNGKNIRGSPFKAVKKE